MPERYEGNLAKTARILNESLADNNMQVIFIATDLTGKTQTLVHKQGPSSDMMLISGMLAEASRIISGSQDKERRALNDRISALEKEIENLKKSNSN